MLSFRKGSQAICEVLAARHLGDGQDPTVQDQQRVVSRWPRRRLRQLARRAEAARRAEPGAVLQEKLETL